MWRIWNLVNLMFSGAKLPLTDNLKSISLSRHCITLLETMETSTLIPLAFPINYGDDPSLSFSGMIPPLNTMCHIRLDVFNKFIKLILKLGRKDRKQVFAKIDLISSSLYKLCEMETKKLAPSS